MVLKKVNTIVCVFLRKAPTKNNIFHIRFSQSSTDCNTLKFILLLGNQVKMAESWNLSRTQHNEKFNRYQLQVLHFKSPLQVATMIKTMFWHFNEIHHFTMQVFKKKDFSNCFRRNSENLYFFTWKSFTERLKREPFDRKNQSWKLFVKQSFSGKLTVSKKRISDNLTKMPKNNEDTLNSFDSL